MPQVSPRDTVNLNTAYSRQWNWRAIFGGSSGTRDGRPRAFYLLRETWGQEAVKKSTSRVYKVIAKPEAGATLHG